MNHRGGRCLAGGALLAATLALMETGCVQGASQPVDVQGGRGGGQPGSGGAFTAAGGGAGSGSGGAVGSGGTTGAGGRITGGGGTTTGAGGATTTGGAGGVTTGGAGAPGGQPAVLTAFVDDFEDGSFLAPPAKWLSTVRSDGDLSQWAITTDGSKVASQSLPADETELVSGDYRWTDAAIEAKVKLTTPDARAGVCVRWKTRTTSTASISRPWPRAAAW
jgi:hypothetical protein